MDSRYRHDVSSPPQHVSTSVERIADQAQTRGWKVATAESLTCGRIVHCLGSGENASTWLVGGVVAYDEEVKYQLLGVTRGR